MIRVVKIGGAIVDDAAQLDAVLDTMQNATSNTILVHGGGRLATEMAVDLGIQQEIVDGRRVTSLDTLRIVTMTYAGWINKNIVAKLQARHVSTIGMSGADGNLILSAIREKTPIDFGYVGDPVNINQTLIADLFETLSKTSRSGYGCLVIAPITHDGQGTLLNTNADTIAADLALAFAPHSELIFAFEHKGVLANVDDPQSYIVALNKADASAMINDGRVHTGMLPKLSNALRAAGGGVPMVRIARYDALDTKEGTWIS